MKLLLTSLILTLLTGIGVLIGVSIGEATQKQNGLGSSLSDNIFGSPVTMSSTTISANASSTTILVKNDRRQYANICAFNASSSVFLFFGTSTQQWAGQAMGTVGIPLGTSGSMVSPCYEIDTSNLYTGAIQAYSTSSPIIITVIEK